MLMLELLHVIHNCIEILKHSDYVFVCIITCTHSLLSFVPSRINVVK